MNEELNATKSKLIRSEVNLSEKEQRLEVLEVERDELARQYYRFGDSSADPLTALGGDTTEESGIEDSEPESIDGSTDRQKNRAQSHLYRRQESEVSIPNSQAFAVNNKATETKTFISDDVDSTTHISVGRMLHGRQRNHTDTSTKTTLDPRPKPK